jgi:hypothetical protein
MSDLATILKQLEAASKEVADLTTKLEAAKAKGRELAEQYAEYHASLMRQFGVEEAEAPKKGKKAAGGAVRWSTTITRYINSADAKLTKAQALEGVRIGLEKLAKKKGVSVPAEVLAEAEKKIGEAFKK